MGPRPNLNNKSYTRNQYTKIVKQNIQQKFNRYWKNRIKNREVEHKLDLYSKIKTKFEVEPYLSLPYFKDRQVISKFRCSNHNLEIEKGRHKKKPRAERLCILCSNNAIETEEHFLLDCPTYNHIRFTSRIHFGLFKKLNMSVANVMTLSDYSDMAKFLKYAFKIRNQIIEAIQTSKARIYLNNGGNLWEMSEYTRTIKWKMACGSSQASTQEVLVSFRNDSAKTTSSIPSMHTVVFSARFEHIFF